MLPIRLIVVYSLLNVVKVFWVWPRDVAGLSHAWKELELVELQILPLGCGGRFFVAVLGQVLRHEELVSLGLLVLRLSLFEPLLEAMIIVGHPRSPLDAWQHAFILIIFSLLFVICFTLYAQFICSFLEKAIFPLISY